MSTFICPIVQIEKAGKHPNADSLSITQISGYNVIFRSDEFAVGGKAVFVPEEALVPQTPVWGYLFEQRVKDGKEVRPKDRVVRAKKIRGIFSCGVLAKVPPEAVDEPVGTDLAGLMGISKFELPEEEDGSSPSAPESWFPKYTSIENARGPAKSLGTRAERLVEGEEVVITEKIHGANARYMLHEGTFVVGSHANAKNPHSWNWWTNVARALKMEEKVRLLPECLIFGEVYGPGTQKGFDYGLKAQTFVLFDIFDLSQGKYVDWEQLCYSAILLDLPLVPVLYRGPWISLEHASQFADGPTVLGNAAHTREGCVVRTIPERWDQYIGRMTLKIIGEEYLLKKGKS